MVCNALLEKQEEIMRGKRAAIYVRVSTSEQDTGLQETELRQYVESRGWECVVYQDKAQSGAKNDRKVLNQLGKTSCALLIAKRNVI
jgi:Resolvase, N terminal domain